MSFPSDPGAAFSQAAKAAYQALLARYHSAEPDADRGVAAPRAVTSDLSVDEGLLLHSIGWDPVDLVCGVSIGALPVGIWAGWGGGGALPAASEAHTRAVATAVGRLREECRAVGGHGVVGVEVELSLQRTHVDVALIGTAVRPKASSSSPAQPFVSDLSARDFSLLRGSGWQPQGLAFGASYIYAPRRSAATAVAQKGKNVELTNYTEALYAARESAMERMQASAMAMAASGVVGVRIEEGPVPFAHHIIGFVSWGTAVRLVADAHRHLHAHMVLPMDDPTATFDASSLRGGA